MQKILCSYKHHTPNQNILLANLNSPMNYKLQNLLHNLDPTTAHSILNSLGTAIVPHVDVLNLMPQFSSQQFQQQQQQKEQSQQRPSSTTTNDTVT